MAPKSTTTAYFLFCAEKRPEVQEQLKADANGEKVSVTAVAKALGQLWKQLTDAERQSYKELAAQKTAENAAAAAAQQEQEGEGEEAGQGQEAEEAGVGKRDMLPLSVVKKIVSLDGDVDRTSKDAVLSLAFAAEAFLHLLAEKCVAVAKQAKRRTIKIEDLQAAVKTDKRLARAGLKDVVQHNLERRDQEASARQQQGAAEAAGDDGDDAAAEAAEGAAAADEGKPAAPAKGGAKGGPAAKKTKVAVDPKAQTLHKFFPAAGKA